MKICAIYLFVQLGPLWALVTHSEEEIVRCDTAMATRDILLISLCPSYPASREKFTVAVDNSFGTSL